MQKLGRQIAARTHRPGWPISTFLVLGLVCGFINIAFAQSYEYKHEYQKKVELIYNFIRFSEWPADTFSTPDQKFIVGVLGKDPFGPAIDQLAGKEVKGREIEVYRFIVGEDVTRAHVLFIGKSEQVRAATWQGQGNLKNLLTRAARKSVMTVGETKNFAEVGGMISFVDSKGKIRFKINREVAKAANIKIGLELVKLGEIVQTKAAPDLSPEPIRVAILPARNLNNYSVLKSEEVFLALADNEDIVVTHVADPELAKAFGADTLKTEPSQKERVWQRAGDQQASRPVIEAVKDMVSELNVRVALMYSYPASGRSAPYPLDVFLVDIDTGEVFRVRGGLLFWTARAGKVKELANNLVRDYLAGLGEQPTRLAKAAPSETPDVAVRGQDLDTGPIRVAILPARHYFGYPTQVLKGKHIFLSLADNEDIVVTHVADPKLAKAFGADTLETESSQQRQIWQRVAIHWASQPDVEAVRDMVRGLNVRIALMSLHPRTHSPYTEFYLFLVDVETGEVFKAQRTMLWTYIGGSDNPATMLEGLAVGLVRDYINGLSGSRADVGKAKAKASKRPRYKGPYTKNVQ